MPNSPQERIKELTALNLIMLTGIVIGFAIGLLMNNILIGILIGMLGAFVTRVWYGKKLKNKHQDGE
ncbi:hypothetical protein [Granulicatella seriolae]|uniref:DUF2273 domain-containing protein n=1 Tax=Granulicatella seriolae TaxID=2967226 RepID=A0ABT1WML9_9LACT|nr:hypothetical protein [Granulicatella seriolae]